jgi:hypothetical protein
MEALIPDGQENPYGITELGGAGGTLSIRLQNSIHIQAGRQRQGDVAAQLHCEIRSVSGSNADPRFCRHFLWHNTVLRRGYCVRAAKGRERPPFCTAFVSNRGITPFLAWLKTLPEISMALPPGRGTFNKKTVFNLNTTGKKQPFIRLPAATTAAIPSKDWSGTARDISITFFATCGAGDCRRGSHAGRSIIAKYRRDAGRWFRKRRGYPPRPSCDICIVRAAPPSIWPHEKR